MKRLFTLASSCAAFGSSRPIVFSRSMHSSTPCADTGNASTISLPKDSVKREQADGHVFGLDIGGTLTKLVYHTKTADQCSLVCRTWNTTKLEDECIPTLNSLVQESQQRHPNGEARLVVTGGGAYRFGKRLKSAFEAATGKHSLSQDVQGPKPGQFETEDEMRCLGNGLEFLQQHVDDEFYIYDSTVFDASRGILLAKNPQEIARRPLRRKSETSAPRQPTLLANVGSGVSYLLCPPQLSPVVKPPEVEMSDPLRLPLERQEPRRVGGTPFGGGTIFGTLRLITGEDDFAKILSLAARGDRTKVDLTVGDIYSKAYTGIGLSGDRAAAILGGVAVGKATETGREEPAPNEDLIKGYSKADVARSVVFGFCYNVGLLAVLHARLHNTAPNICFAGNLIRDNEIVMSDIDFGVQANSDHKMRATFMRHGGFLGAIGAWVQGMQTI